MQNLFDQLILEALIKITGPAILYKPKTLVKGGIGTGHADLWVEKLPKAVAKNYNVSISKAEDMIQNAPENKIIDGFMTSDGKFVTREQAWKIAQTYKKDIQAMAQARDSKTGKLASEHL